MPHWTGRELREAEWLEKRFREDIVPAISILLVVLVVVLIGIVAANR